MNSPVLPPDSPDIDIDYDEEEEEEEEEEEDDDDDVDDDDDDGNIVDDDDDDDDDDDAGGGRRTDSEGPTNLSGLAGGGQSLVRAVLSLASLSSDSYREIGRDAVCWSLSSAKPGNGVEQIRDDSIETYWQSDGSQPHTIQITLARRLHVSHVCLYLDYNLDESYTPKKLRVQTGMTLQDLTTSLVAEVQEPVGWCILPLEYPDDDPVGGGAAANTNSSNANNNGSTATITKSHMVVIQIISMHQNGRDTHIRQVKLFGPRSHDTLLRLATNPLLRAPQFQTVALSQYSTIR